MSTDVCKSWMRNCWRGYQSCRRANRRTKLAVPARGQHRCTPCTGDHPPAGVDPSTNAATVRCSGPASDNGASRRPRHSGHPYATATGPALNLTDVSPPAPLLLSLQAQGYIYIGPGIPTVVRLRGLCVICSQSADSSLNQSSTDQC